MLSNAPAVLKCSLSAVKSLSWIGLQAAGFSAARTTPQNLSKAVSIASKRIKEKPGGSLDKPDKLKAKTPRTVSAYNLFLKDEVTRLRSLDKTIPVKDLFKTVSQNWQALPDAQRQPYLEQAGAKNEAVHKLKASLKAEARPINAYAKFVQEMMPSLKASYPGLSAPELMRRAAEAWRLVSAAEKARRQEQYLSNMSEWRAKQEAGPQP